MEDGFCGHEVRFDFSTRVVSGGMLHHDAHEFAVAQNLANTKRVSAQVQQHGSKSGNEGCIPA
eukprot:221220-Rhodomonas_salina.2